MSGDKFWCSYFLFTTEGKMLFQVGLKWAVACVFTSRTSNCAVCKIFTSVLSTAWQDQDFTVLGTMIFSAPNLSPSTSEAEADSGLGRYKVVFALLLLVVANIVLRICLTSFKVSSRLKW